MAKTNHTVSTVVEIKNYPASLIHRHKSDNGDEFNSLSFRWKDQWASCILPTEAVSQSTSRKGETIEGRMNISLGEPDQVRNVSIQMPDSSYKRTPMFNRSILSAITSQRESYLKSIAV